MNGPAHSFPSNSPHPGPRVEQGTANNNSNSIPFSLSVKTNGDSDLVETFIQYALHIQAPLDQKSPHTGPWVEQGTANNNSNSIPFSLSVKTNGDSDLDETFTQYA